LEGRVPSRPAGLQGALPCRDGTRHSHSRLGGPGSIPANRGFSGHCRVEMELDTPIRALEGRVPSRPTGVSAGTAVSRWNSTLPFARWRAGSHPGQPGFQGALPCRDGTRHSHPRLGGPGSIPASGVSASTLCRDGTRHSRRAWRAGFHPGQAEFAAGAAVSRWNSTLPFAPWRAGFHPGQPRFQRALLCRDETRHSHSRLGGPGSIPASGGFSGHCRVEMKLDTPIAPGVPGSIPAMRGFSGHTVSR